MLSKFTDLYQKTSKIEIESDISSSPDPIPISESCGFKIFLTNQIAFINNQTKLTKYVFIGQKIEEKSNS